MNYIESRQFNHIVHRIALGLASGPDVEVGEWQAIRSDGFPFTKTIELEDVSFEVLIPDTIEDWQTRVEPNLPWAEDHFQERVSGVPHNPPPSHEWWPFAQRNNDQHRKDEKFSHTYPERIWPRYANDALVSLYGIRFPYGDLDDLVKLLKERPGTRQAYLPIWFPEDLFAAAEENERVPCTLGYHFLLRQGKLKIVYYIRSCDFYRHFRDDVYMAGRLCQWVAERVGADPDRLVMHISSMHIFSVERSRVVADASA